MGNVLGYHVVLALPDDAKALLDKAHTLFHVSGCLGSRPSNGEVCARRIGYHSIHVGRRMVVLNPNISPNADHLIPGFSVWLAVAADVSTQVKD